MEHREFRQTAAIGPEPERRITELMERYPALRETEAEIRAAFVILRDCFAAGGKLLIAGNGGSCADAEHIVGELMKGFVKPRPVDEETAAAFLAADPELGPLLASRLQRGLPAIALTGHPGLTTAFANDVDGSLAFAQQVLGYGRKGDVFLGISTSGNSQNVYGAAVAARALGLSVIGLLGRGGGKIRPLCDAAIVAPERETYKIQELHLPVYHALCLMLEEEFF